MDLKKVEKILEKYKIKDEEMLEDIIVLAVKALAIKDTFDEVLETIDLLTDDKVQTQ